MSCFPLVSLALSLSSFTSPVFCSQLHSITNHPQYLVSRFLHSLCQILTVTHSGGSGLSLLTSRHVTSRHVTSRHVTSRHSFMPSFVLLVKSRLLSQFRFIVFRLSRDFLFCFCLNKSSFTFKYICFRVLPPPRHATATLLDSIYLSFLICCIF